MSKNDDKIKELLTKISDKKEKLGTKPKANWKTNGLLDIDSTRININVINSLDKCIEIASKIIHEINLYRAACAALEIPSWESRDGDKRLTYIKDALDDIKLRTKIIVWENDKKKLVAMEKQVKDLRSADAKTADALSEIESSL